MSDPLQHDASVLHDAVLNDTSVGIADEQCLYAAVWSDGDITLVTQDVAHPIGPDIQRPGVLTNRRDFLEFVASTFNVAVYEVDSVVEELPCGAAALEELACIDIVISQEDVGYHERV